MPLRGEAISENAGTHVLGRESGECKVSDVEEGLLYSKIRKTNVTGE